MIVGIDEVGRGPWAGPLVVGAVVLGDVPIEGLTDSKKLSKHRREELTKTILDTASACGLGWVDATEIDSLGLSASLTLATKRALEQVTVPYHEIIIDGTVNFLKDTGKGRYVTTMKKADLLIGAVSAASIIAKVARDDYMAEYALKYPEYGFESHVGYGTAKHQLALKEHGVTEEHRKSFAPISALIAGNSIKKVRSIKGTATHIGSMAEHAACEWLRRDGFEITDRNWKTRFCEIDIVASKHDVLYFVEVKHRKAFSQGGGVAAITEKKLRQMRFAASLYLSRSTVQDARLAVVTTHGTDQIEIEQLLFVE